MSRSEAEDSGTATRQQEAEHKGFLEKGPGRTRQRIYPDMFPVQPQPGVAVSH